MNSIRIMVVEDEAITLEYMRITINNLGYKVVGNADSGEDAIELSKTINPDLVLMDIHLKGKIDGIDAASYIQENFNIPVIYLTAFCDDETLERAKITDPYGYLLKPVNTMDLKIAIEIVLSKHQLRMKLIESEAKYRSIFENSLDTIFVLSKDGEFIDINESGLEFFGYQRKELTTFFSEQFFKHSIELKTLQKTLIESGYVRDMELHLLKKSGSPITGKLSAVAVKANDQQVTGFQGMIKDVSREKILEEQLLQSMKMESIGRFAAGISHDFNNLLTIINGYTEALLMKTKEYKQKSDLKIISRAGEKAANLVSQILAYSRKQPINPIEININDIINELKKMINRILRKDIHMKFELSPDILSIYMDSCQFEQIVMNLIVNARDAMFLGGTLTIETLNTSINSDMVTNYPFLKNGNYVELRVRDTGAGMSPDTIEKIFEPFFTTKNKEEGTGLGLATVFGIIKQNKGFILVTSKPKKGTTIRVFFPIYDKKAIVSATDTLFENISFPPLTILIVEDELGLRNLLADIFHHFGFKTLKAEDTTQAIKIVQSFPDKIDILFTDVILPGEPVSKMTDKIKKVQPQIKIIYSSGYTMDIIEKMGLNPQLIHFIKKPYSKKDIINVIQHVLKGEANETN